jgi:hypothetical protein
MTTYGTAYQQFELPQKAAHAQRAGTAQSA